MSAMSHWQVVTFPAWRDRRYTGLAEILVRLGGYGLDLEWGCYVDEVAPEPGLEQLAELTPGTRLGTLALLALAAPDRQVVDGRFDGFGPGGEPVCRIRPVDSKDWDLEATEPELLSGFATAYPAAHGPGPLGGR